MSKQAIFATGYCACERITYQLSHPPLFTHCCHCTWCQRETGSAFVLNAMIEASAVVVTKGNAVVIDTPSNSGRGQQISRCPDCHVALWSSYSGIGEKVLFVRVGTLKDPILVPPDIHIFTPTKLPWVILGHDVPQCAGFYDRQKYWPVASLDRLTKALA